MKADNIRRDPHDREKYNTDSLFLQSEGMPSEVRTRFQRGARMEVQWGVARRRGWWKRAAVGAARIRQAACPPLTKLGHPSGWSALDENRGLWYDTPRWGPWCSLVEHTGLSSRRSRVQIPSAPQATSSSFPLGPGCGGATAPTDQPDPGQPKKRPTDKVGRFFFARGCENALRGYMYGGDSGDSGDKIIPTPIYGV